MLSGWANFVENSVQDGLPKISNFQATLNVLISHKILACIIFWCFLELTYLLCHQL